MFIVQQRCSNPDIKYFSQNDNVEKVIQKNNEKARLSNSIKMYLQIQLTYQLPHLLLSIHLNSIY